VLFVALGLAVGCTEARPFDGPTVDAFTGRLVKEGKPVSFSTPGEQVILRLIHEKGQSFGIPIGPDGSFKIGWMPIGKYSGILTRQRDGVKGGPGMYNVPGGLEIVGGKTEYDVELGKNWKP